MSETRILTCIGCPMGCRLTVTMEGEKVTSVAGNTCRRGDDYARREVTAPARVLTTTVPVVGGVRPRVPVKTAVEVTAPVHAGDVVCRDILGTGVDVIAVRDTPKA